MTTQRRNVLKAAAFGAASAGISWPQQVHGEASAKQLSVAGYAYDRIRAIQDGLVGIDGFDVDFTAESIYALNASFFGPGQKYMVSEVGLIPYISKFVNEGHRDYTLVPVPISRIFRHRNIFVRTDSGIEKPEDLRGRRVGTTHYGSSAVTWIKGMLADQYGVRPQDMHWVEALESSDGATPRPQEYFLPEGITIEKGPEGIDESELIVSGEVDALVSPITPKAILEGDPTIKPLFADVRAAEEAYYRDSGVFPIMHVIGIRQDVVDQNPDLPRAVFEMYSKAKAEAYHNLETTTALKVTLPWATQDFADAQKLMGDNFWPYGLEANRKEFDLIPRYMYEHGLLKRKMKAEELFHPSTIDLMES